MAGGLHPLHHQVLLPDWVVEVCGIQDWVAQKTGAVVKLYLVPYWGFNHEAVAKQFGGDLSFVNEFCVNEEYMPVAVYRAAKPDRKKGHKKYMLLQMQGKQGLVRGMSAKEMETWRYQDGLLCLDCNTVIYSTMRHDMHSCECGEISVDGGREYLRCSYGHGRSKMVKIDLLENRALVDGVWHELVTGTGLERAVKKAKGKK